MANLTSTFLIKFSRFMTSLKLKKGFFNRVCSFVVVVCGHDNTIVEFYSVTLS